MYKTFKFEYRGDPILHDTLDSIEFNVNNKYPLKSVDDAEFMQELSYVLDSIAKSHDFNHVVDEVLKTINYCTVIDDDFIDYPTAIRGMMEKNYFKFNPIVRRSANLVCVHVGYQQYLTYFNHFGFKFAKSMKECILSDFQKGLTDELLTFWENNEKADEAIQTALLLYSNLSVVEPLWKDYLSNSFIITLQSMNPAISIASPEEFKGSFPMLDNSLSEKTKALLLLPYRLVNEQRM